MYPLFIYAPPKNHRGATVVLRSPYWPMWVILSTSGVNTKAIVVNSGSIVVHRGHLGLSGPPVAKP